MSDKVEDGATGSNQFKFKKPSRKPLRQQRRKEDEDEADKSEDNEEENLLDKLEEAKEIQRLRERPHGISAVALAVGKKMSIEEEVCAQNDPFKVNSGGMADMKAIKSKPNNNAADDAYETGIGTHFSVETNTRDEDAEMMKYIEEQLAKRKGQLDEEEDKSSKYLTPEEVAFSSVSEYLRKKSTVQSEEMLSNQMLSGIPEVDLGIEAKIKNIEATEEAKQKLLQERLRKRDGPSLFVPTNMAVNFVQHNRFNIEESGPRNKRRAEAPASEPASNASALPKRRDPGAKKEHDKASDDFYFEKFRRQFRR